MADILAVEADNKSASTCKQKYIKQLQKKVEAVEAFI
jgi:hypothetical protein